MRHHPTAFSYLNEYFCDYGNPQWIKNINPLSFPLSKQEAAERPHVIQNAFHQIIGSLSPSSLVAYTDGSLTTNCSCSCAVFIIGYTGIAKKLTPGSRIYSAKLEGIQLALEFFLSLPNPPEELVLLRFPISRASYLGIPTTLLPSIHHHYQATCKCHHHVRHQSLDHLDPQPRRKRRKRNG